MSARPWQVCCVNYVTVKYHGFVLVIVCVCLCSCSDSYEKVKENEIVEALHERAKIIVDFELLYPTGFPFFDGHAYGDYMHILTACDPDSEKQEWRGITGRVKQLLALEITPLKQEIAKLRKLLVEQGDAKKETGSVNTFENVRAA